MMKFDMIRQILEKHLLPVEDFIYGFADLTHVIDESRCGNCTKCTDRCPADAISGKLWNISVDRDEFFDAFKCREKCKEYGEKFLKMNVRVCGICVAVCPFGW